MADSAYTSRLVYLTGADMLKLPGSHATGLSLPLVKHEIQLQDPGTSWLS